MVRASLLKSACEFHHADDGATGDLRHLVIFESRRTKAQGMSEQSPKSKTFRMFMEFELPRGDFDCYRNGVTRWCPRFYAGTSDPGQVYSSCSGGRVSEPGTLI